MKRASVIILALLFAGLSGLVLLKIAKEKVRSDLAQPVAYPSITIAPTHIVDKNARIKSSLFVPYWTLNDDIAVDQYDTFIYFGIAAQADGIAMQEAGVSNMDVFLEKVPAGKRKLLVVRMINTPTNFVILKDQTKQKKIISESLALAKQHGFDGVILNLELSAIPFDSLIQQISSFSKAFSTQAHKNHLSYGMTLYGDTFYRIRPFDVKTLVKSTDEIFIMAYDFHKSNSNPGPNFPLLGRDTYGYDMDKMIDNFLQFVPSKKVTVIFGLYGYDWVVDKQKKATEQGKPLTNHEIQQKFLSECLYSNCSVRRHNQSKETEIGYTDEQGNNHIVWFEDMTSVAAKQKLLKQKGVSSFSFWANSYF